MDQPLKIQPKLTVGPVNDAYEQEADRMADTVMRMPGPRAQPSSSPLGMEKASHIQPLSMAEGTVQRQELKRGGEEEELRRKAVDSNSAVEASPDVTSRIQAMRGQGQPLSASTQSFFESRMGYDFSQVRVHANSHANQTAHALNARAFTLGRDIVFNAGQYVPESSTGRHLLAHELTHVVQQQGSGVQAQNADPIRRLPVHPLVQRAISPELDEIEGLLSYGFFDWKIRDAEAIRALEILASLPRFQQATFFANRKFVDRLRDNLPDDRIQELNDLEVSVGPIQPPTGTVEDIRSKLSRGLFDWAVTEKDAIQALEMLKQLSGTELAVALAAINHGRLMDNLPDSRKRELIDLLAQTLATGGARDVEENANPGTLLSSITFTSDHGVMKNQTENWSASGSIYPQPEWSVADGRVRSHPVSQTKNTNVTADVNLNILPATAPSAPVKLTGRSDVGFLNFNYSGTLSGGTNQTVSLTSTGSLPNRVTEFRDKQIRWTMEWRDWKHDIGVTGGHTFYVTMNDPLAPSEVTQKRMALSVGLIKDIYTSDAHELVRRIMSTWGYYDLDIQYSNAWEMADNLEAGAQCIDIVRFMNGLLQTVGAPGTAHAVVVWAHPDASTMAIEEPWGLSGSGLHKVPPRTIGGVRVFAGLMDSNGCPNAYEAALKYDYSSIIKYYPGGVSMNREYLTPTDVLHIFQCLAWLEPIERKVYRIEAIPATYPGGSCTPSARIRCRS